MKIITSKSLFTLALLSLSIAVPQAEAVPAKQVFVQVRSSKLRSGPQVWAPAVAPLKYGDAVTIQEKESTAGWLKVTSQGRVGFVHVSSITDKRVVLGSAGRGEASGLSSSDIVLAGKGFNKEVEKEFAGKRALDFSKVDRIERLSVSDSEIGAFIKNGKLGGGK